MTYINRVVLEAFEFWPTAGIRQNGVDLSLFLDDVLFLSIARTWRYPDWTKRKPGLSRLVRRVSCGRLTDRLKRKRPSDWCAYIYKSHMSSTVNLCSFIIFTKCSFESLWCRLSYIQLIFMLTFFGDCVSLIRVHRKIQKNNAERQTRWILNGI